MTSVDSYLDVLDRILDKGIVIEAWMRFGLVDIDLHTGNMESRIVVTSIDTYLTRTHARAGLDLVSLPRPVKPVRPKRKHAV